MIYRILLFLVINFAALGIGGLFTGSGVSSDWYTNLNKAPWTPPGWVFGAAWTTIMICFAIYMAYAWENSTNRSLLIILFIIQWILNVSWNPTFFHYHQVAFSLLLITSLTLLVAYFLFGFGSVFQANRILAAPYFIWLLIATSLNAYILVNN